MALLAREITITQEVFKDDKLVARKGGGVVANVNRGVPIGSNAPPFIKGQIVSLQEYDNTMGMYAVNNGYELQRSKSSKKDRAIPNTYYKWQCSRGGKPSNKGIGARPQRTSLKVGCGCYVNACHPMKEDKTGRDETVVEIEIIYWHRP